MDEDVRRLLAKRGWPRLERESRRRHILLDAERAETFRRLGALETGPKTGNLSEGIRICHDRYVKYVVRWMRRQEQQRRADIKRGRKRKDANPLALL
jgi:hypothetical protein